MNQSFTKYLWLLPAVLAFAVNVNVLQNGYVWDDHYILRIHEESPFGASLNQGPNRTYHRPAVGWSYRMDRRLWGENPAGYHFTNLLIHTANTVLVFFLGQALITVIRNSDGPVRGPSPAESGRNALRPYTVIPLIASLLFAVHPIHAEAVAWIPGRNDLLPAFFLLIAFVLHVRLRSGGRPAWILPVWASVVFLALLSKESAFPFLLIFPLYDLIVRPTDRRGWRWLVTPTTVAAFLIGIVYLILRSRQLGSPAGAVEVDTGAAAHALPTLLYSLGFYIRHLAYPFPLNAFILPPVRTGPGEIALMFLGVLSIGALVAMSAIRKTRFLSLSLWAVFLGLAMPLIVPLVKVTHAPVAERYLYLPSIGFSFLITVLLVWAVDRIKPVRPSPVVSFLSVFLAVLLLAALAAASHSRNTVWRDDLHLWENTVLKSPSAAVPHNLLGLVYRQQDRYDDAAREFEQAVESRGSIKTRALAASNLGGIYYSERRFELAETAYEKAIGFDSNLHLPYYNLGVLYWERYRSGEGGRAALLEKAKSHLVKAVILNPTDANSYFVLGLVNLSLDRADKAREDFEKAVRLAPASPFGQAAAGKLMEMNGAP